MSFGLGSCCPGLGFGWHCLVNITVFLMSKQQCLSHKTLRTVSSGTASTVLFLYQWHLSNFCQLFILTISWFTMMLFQRVTDNQTFKQQFSRWTWVSRYQNVAILDFIGARMELMVTTGAIRCAKLQLNCHHQQTNTQLFNRPDALPVAQPTVSKH